MLATGLLACFGFLPQTNAAPEVAPPPDGCYSQFNTAEGCQALQFLTSGAGNTGLGWRSLYATAAGSFNTGVGAGALVLNTDNGNTAVGAVALLLNTSGTDNTAVGTGALELTMRLTTWALVRSRSIIPPAVPTPRSAFKRWRTTPHTSRTWPWVLSRPRILTRTSTRPSAAFRSAITLVAPETPPSVLERSRV